MATASIDVAKTVNAAIDVHMAAVIDLGLFLKLESKKLGMSFFATQAALAFVSRHGPHPDHHPRRQTLYQAHRPR